MRIGYNIEKNDSFELKKKYARGKYAKIQVITFVAELLFCFRKQQFNLDPMFNILVVYKNTYKWRIKDIWGYS